MATGDLMYNTTTGAIRYRKTDPVGGDGGLRYKMAATATVYMFGTLSAYSQSYSTGEYTLDWMGDTVDDYTAHYLLDGHLPGGTSKGMNLEWDGSEWTLTIEATDFAFGSPPTNGYAKSVWTCPTIAGIYELDSTAATGSGVSAVTAVYVNALAVYDWSADTSPKRYEGGDTDASLTTAVANALSNLDSDSSTVTGYTYVFTLHSVVRSGASSYFGSAVRGYAQIAVPAGVTGAQLIVGTTRYTSYPASGTIYVGLRSSAPASGTQCRTFDTALYDYALGASADLTLNATGWAWGAAGTKYICIYMATGSWSGVSLSVGQNAGFSAVLSRLVFV